MTKSFFASIGLVNDSHAQSVLFYHFIDGGGSKDNTTLTKQGKLNANQPIKFIKNTVNPVNPKTTLGPKTGARFWLYDENVDLKILKSDPQLEFSLKLRPQSDWKVTLQIFSSSKNEIVLKSESLLIHIDHHNMVMVVNS